MRPFAVLALPLLSALVTAQVDRNTTDFFFNPGVTPPNWVDNQRWVLGSQHTVEWISTNAASYTIELWQQGMDAGQISKTGNAQKIVTIFTSDENQDGYQSYNWNISAYTSNLTFSNIFYLWINPNQPTSIVSAYFNISSDSASTPNVSPVVSSQTPASPATSSSCTAVVTSTSYANSSNNSLALGLGVGLGVGIVTLLIAAVWTGIKAMAYRKRIRAVEHDHGPLHHEANMSDYKYGRPTAPTHMSDAKTSHAAAELNAYHSKSPFELRGETYAAELG